MYFIYGRKNCSWCNAAKAILNDNAILFTYKDIEKDIDARMEFFEFFPFAKTVPQILLETPNDGDHEYKRIGGYEDLRQWLKPSTTK